MTGAAAERVGDAAEAGLALAFPVGLRARMDELAAQWAPLDRAVAAGWAGLDRLRVETLAANGVAPVRDRSVRGLDQGGLSGLAEVGELPGEAARQATIESRVGGGGVAARIAAWAAGAVAPLRRGGPAGQNGRGAGSRVASGEMAEVGGRSADEAWAAELTAGAGGTAAVPSGGGVPLAALQGVEAVAPVMGSAARMERATVLPGSGGGRSSGGGIVAMPAAVTVVSAAPVRGAGRSAMTADVGAALRGRSARAEALRLDAGVAGLGGEAMPGAARSAAFISRVGRGAVGSGLGGVVAGAGAGGLDGGFAPAAGGGGAGGAGQGPSGAVMLDGRLVGHWVSDGMARDAARPGTGITGFDSRQAPAWTPSGVF